LAELKYDLLDATGGVWIIGLEKMQDAHEVPWLKHLTVTALNKAKKPLFMPKTLNTQGALDA
jgi:hypothetical protein